MKQEDQNQNPDTGIESRGASMAPIQDGVARLNDDPEIDDGGTDQSEALQILTDLRDGAFDSSDAKLAAALGRPSEEIEEWLKGDGTIDGDVLLKARALASERGIEIE
jgi:hypothetical protein